MKPKSGVDSSVISAVERIFRSDMIALPIPVVDLFAGPGGLGEGFASYQNHSIENTFRLRLSVEMDRDAHTTLELRSFFRQFPKDQVPPEYFEHLRRDLSRDELFGRYPIEARRARNASWLAELGKVPAKELNRRIRDAVGDHRNWVLCGGPPCQAYSVVGRSRRGGIDHSDNRVYLYREYLNILAEHEPPVFIMENVKGLLSSQVRGKGLFAQLLADLHAPGPSIGRRSSPFILDYKDDVISEKNTIHTLTDYRKYVLQQDRPSRRRWQRAHQMAKCFLQFPDFPLPRERRKRARVKSFSCETAGQPSEKLIGIAADELLQRGHVESWHIAIVALRTPLATVEGTVPAASSERHRSVRGPRHHVDPIEKRYCYKPIRRLFAPPKKGQSVPVGYLPV
jgi:hypothetical protein